jgi:hypothetical protein
LFYPGGRSGRMIKLEKNLSTIATASNCRCSIDKLIDELAKGKAMEKILRK